MVYNRNYKRDKKTPYFVFKKRITRAQKEKLRTLYSRRINKSLKNQGLPDNIRQLIGSYAGATTQAKTGRRYRTNATIAYRKLGKGITSYMKKKSAAQYARRMARYMATRYRRSDRQYYHGGMFGYKPSTLHRHRNEMSSKSTMPSAIRTRRIIRGRAEGRARFRAKYGRRSYLAFKEMGIKSYKQFQ